MPPFCQLHIKSLNKSVKQIGQGGNQAIESAAVLTNCLMEVFSKIPDPTQRPTMSDLEPAFKKFQTIRWKRARMFIKMSGLITRTEANAKLSDTIRLLFTKPLSTEFIAGKLPYCFV